MGDEQETLWIACNDQLKGGYNFRIFFKFYTAAFLGRDEKSCKMDVDQLEKGRSTN